MRRDSPSEAASWDSATDRVVAVAVAGALDCSDAIACGTAIAQAAERERQGRFSRLASAKMRLLGTLDVDRDDLVTLVALGLISVAGLVEEERVRNEPTRGLRKVPAGN